MTEICGGLYVKASKLLRVILPFGIGEDKHEGFQSLRTYGWFTVNIKWFASPSEHIQAEHILMAL